MLICIQMQFKRSSRETEGQVKQHEAQNLNRLSSIKPRLKKSFFFKKKRLVQYFVSLPLTQNR